MLVALPSEFGAADPIVWPMYSLDGWVGNCTDPYGVEWIVTAEEGWSSAPPTRATFEDLPGQDGGSADPVYYSSRVITLSGMAKAPDQESMLAAKDRFSALLSGRGSYPLVVVDRHLTRLCQVRRTSDIKLADAGAAMFSWSLIVTATDPRKYGYDLYTADTTLPAQTVNVGRTYPRHYALTYPVAGTGGQAGQIQLPGFGTYDAGALITFHGPVSNPAVQYIEGGQTLGFALTVAAGESLEVDLLARTARLNGVASRRSTLTRGSAWFLIDTSRAATLAFHGIQVGVPSPPTNPQARMTVAWAPAWI
jgi:hypothetical protein